MGPSFDMDALRTMVVGTELGSFVRAATKLGRSQSAIHVAPMVRDLRRRDRPVHKRQVVQSKLTAIDGEPNNREVIYHSRIYFLGGGPSDQEANGWLIGARHFPSGGHRLGMFE